MPVSLVMSRQSLGDPAHPYLEMQVIILASGVPLTVAIVVGAGEDAIRHLLSRGTHREFGYAALMVMLVFYFGGAAWAAGSAVASGLFVPMLLIGACIGRLVGLAAVDVAAASHAGSSG